MGWTGPNKYSRIRKKSKWKELNVKWLEPYRPKKTIWAPCNLFRSNSKLDKKEKWLISRWHNSKKIDKCIRFRKYG